MERFMLDGQTVDLEKLLMYLKHIGVDTRELDSYLEGIRTSSVLTSSP
ncbi:hypothetical protein DES34_102527 [Brevibacillus brevis]|nr:hypothetical protein DES34_102527 [Brevibacillus brevis]GEC91554.1 hypothetical protein BBR01nite_38850 [Brevibacillus brevis]VEF92074.1 Uncharacterised protein [Brevibacillus brevis]